MIKKIDPPLTEEPIKKIKHGYALWVSCWHSDTFFYLPTQEHQNRFTHH